MDTLSKVIAAVRGADTKQSQNKKNNKDSDEEGCESVLSVSCRSL